MTRRVITTTLMGLLLFGAFCIRSLPSRAIGLPKVTTPAVSVGSAHASSVTVPSVTVPSVTVPSVTVPPVKTPAATTPSVSTPSVTTPSPSTPSLSPRPPADLSSPAAGASSQTTAGSAASSGPAGTGSPSGSSDSSASRPGAALTQAGRQRANDRRQSTEDRRLRALVTRDRTCLTALPSSDQRLLALRAGLNGAPRSASATARILGVGPTREGRLEQAALTALQLQAGAGCGTTPATITVPADHRLIATAPWLLTAAPATGSATSTSSVPGSLVRHATRGTHHVLSEAPATAHVQRADLGSRSPGSGFPVLLVCLLCGLAIVAAVVPARWRRLRLAAAAAPDLDSPAAAPARYTLAAAPEPKAPAAAPEPDTPAPGPPPRTAVSAPPPLPTAAPVAAPPAPRTQVQDRPQRAPSRLRVRGSHVALVFTVLGGAARLLLRNRSRSSR